ncbi:MAG: polysaccharide deacetylase family protein [Candidatus Wallbacteria bacterium]|nr:polysaccharide deacetylase family protein [Candidatus Wallbacteria bacterium]
MTLAILVYHRIVDGDRERFHDVLAATFESHLDHLAAQGARHEGEGLLRLADGRAVFLTFDDATADHAGVAARLERHAYRGVFLVPAGRLGEAGRLTASDVSELSARGHIVGSHGLTHRRFDRMAAKELDEELAGSRQILSRLCGREVLWLAPPGGLCPEGLTGNAFSHGYRVVRGMRWGLVRAGGILACSSRDFHGAGQPNLGAGVVQPETPRPRLGLGLVRDEAEGPLPVLPVTSRTSAAAFPRLLSGKGWAFLQRLRELGKTVLGESLWDGFRERWRR